MISDHWNPKTNGRSPKSSGIGFTLSPRKDLFNCSDSPGPGSYEVKSRDSTRTFQLRGKKKEKPNNVPGPGAYSPKFIVKKSSTSTIGKSKRTELTVALDTPGPGSYDGKIQAAAPRWSFHGIKDASFASSTPGPGKYNSIDLNRSVGGSSTRTSRPELFTSTVTLSPNPGPGSYDSRAGKFASLQYSVGKSKRPGVDSKTPGPGRYEPKSLNHSFSAKFGNEAKKTLEFGNDVPPPSTYSPKSLDKAPNYSFAKKLEVKPGNRNPGPGKYSVNKQEKVIQGKLSKSMRFIKTYSEKEINSIPGPGSYEIKSELNSAKVYVSKAKREFKPNNVPGPGRYNA